MAPFLAEGLDEHEAAAAFCVVGGVRDDGQVRVVVEDLDHHAAGHAAQRQGDALDLVDASIGLMVWSAGLESVCDQFGNQQLGCLDGVWVELPGVQGGPGVASRPEGRAGQGHQFQVGEFTAGFASHRDTLALPPGQDRCGWNDIFAMQPEAGSVGLAPAGSTTICRQLSAGGQAVVGSDDKSSPEEKSPSAWLTGGNVACRRISAACVAWH